MNKPLSREKVLEYIEDVITTIKNNRKIDQYLIFEKTHQLVDLKDTIKRGDFDADEPARETIQALVGCKKCGVLFPGTISFGNAYCPSHRDEKKEDSNVEEGKPTIDVDCVIDEIEKEKQFSESQKYEEFHRGRGAGLNSAIAIIESKLKKEPAMKIESFGINCKDEISMMTSKPFNTIPIEDMPSQSHELPAKIICINCNTEINGIKFPDGYHVNHFCNNKIENPHTCGKCYLNLEMVMGEFGGGVIMPCEMCNKNKIDADELVSDLDRMYAKFACEYNLGVSDCIDYIKSKIPKKEEELKPCECGGKPITYYDIQRGYRIYCGHPNSSSCYKSTAYYKTQAEAKAAWNKRA
jgi:hypothetical protein